MNLFYFVFYNKNKNRIGCISARYPVFLSVVSVKLICNNSFRSVDILLSQMFKVTTFQFEVASEIFFSYYLIVSKLFGCSLKQNLSFE